jgi:hypothetical protein
MATSDHAASLTELEIRSELFNAMDGNLRMSKRHTLLDAYRDAVLAAHQPAPAARATILREGEARLRVKAQELSALAEEELRRDLEDQAQVWHEAATELACMAALGLMPAEAQQVTP